MRTLLRHLGAAWVAVGGITTAMPLALPAQGRGPAARAAAPYYPGRGADWARRSAASVGLDSARLAAAIAFAVTNETRNPRSMEENQLPDLRARTVRAGGCPFRDRGDPSGVILRHGYNVASWGDPDRVDMTHSVTKSFLSSVVGVAVDRGLIRSLDDTVSHAIGPVAALPGGPATTAVTLLEPFATPHNRRITWDHLLRQVSDFEGTLWGKPEWADRPTGDAPSGAHGHASIPAAPTSTTTCG